MERFEPRPSRNRDAVSEHRRVTTTWTSGRCCEPVPLWGFLRKLTFVAPFADEVEAALEEVKKAMTEGGLDKITSATDKLTTASHKLAEAMYKSQSAAPNGAAPAGEPPTPEKPKDNVVDAEFVDVEDKK